MECVICKSDDVPERGGNYLSNRQVPFTVGGQVYRLRLIYPSDKPLCNACRVKIVEGTINNGT